MAEETTREEERKAKKLESASSVARSVGRATASTTTVHYIYLFHSFTGFVNTSQTQATIVQLYVLYIYPRILGVITEEKITDKTIDKTMKAVKLRLRRLGRR